MHLDPTGDVPLAFVSHAHAAHADASAEIVASPETIADIERRRGAPLPNARALAWQERIERPLASGATAKLSLAPSGYMRGAAQLVVDHPGGRFVYTGDVGGEGFEVVACDELVIESTYALPIFRFPPRARELDALASYCRANASAVVLAEDEDAIAAELGARGVQARVVSLRERPAKTKGKIALASGAALLDAVVERRRADAAFVVSSHADSDALVAIAEKTGARHVIATHGDAVVLAKLLAEHGIEAYAIELPPIDEAP